MECEAAEVALEQRAAGALEAAESAALEQHLAGCAACREQAELIALTAGALRANHAAYGAAGDPERVRARVDDLVRRYRSALPRMAAAMCVLVPLIGWATAGEALWGSLVLGGFILVFGWVQIRRKVQALLPAGDPAQDFFEAYRAELRERRRRLATGTVIELAMGVFLVVLFAVLAWRGPTEAAPWRLILFQGAWGVALLAAAAWHLLVDRPRVLAEQAALEEPGA